MSMNDDDFANLMSAFRGGDKQAWASLVRLIYEDLRRVARANLIGHSADRTLNTTSLVHECYFRIVGVAQNSVESKHHFLRLASRIMRQVLCDRAREQLAIKRGGDQRKEQIDEIDIAIQEEAQELVELDQLLRRLEETNERMARVFEQRYFCGLSEQECADTLKLKLRTVQRDWNGARAWLAKQFGAT